MILDPIFNSFDTDYHLTDNDDAKLLRRLFSLAKAELSRISGAPRPVDPVSD